MAADADIRADYLARDGPGNLVLQLLWSAQVAQIKRRGSISPGRGSSVNEACCINFCGFGKGPAFLKRFGLVGADDGNTVGADSDLVVRGLSAICAMV